MFRFVHCADLHLDSPLRGLSAKPDAPGDEIRTAARRALKNLVDLCVSEGVDFVVIAGDVYDGDWQDYSTGLFFSACMAELNDRGIPVFLISGNHDAASRITRRLALPKNVTRFSERAPETHFIEPLGVALHGQGFRERETRKNLVPDYPDAVPGYFNIGLLHTSLEGQEGHETYAPCRVSELVQKGYGYWALGHVHSRRVVHENPYIVYPGNIQGRHVRETGDKGCTLVTVDGGEVSLEHRSLDVLRFFVCTVDLSGCATDGDFFSAVSGELERRVEENPGYPLAVRIRLCGRTSLHGRLFEESDRFAAEIENAANMASGRIWLEKVRVETEPAAGRGEWDLHGGVEETLPHGPRLSRIVEGAVSDAGFVDEFLAHAKAVQDRMKAYIKRDDAVRVDSAEDLEPLMRDAWELLRTMGVKGDAL